MKWLSCPTLCDPMDCSLPCSSIHGVFQARVLEWVAISFSIYQRYHLKERLTWELFLGRQGNLHESMVHDSQLSNSGSEAETFTGEKNWYFCLQGQGNLTWKSYLRNFPGGLVAKILCSQCREPRFEPWSGTRSHMPQVEDPACLN